MDSVAKTYSIAISTGLSNAPGGMGGYARGTVFVPAMTTGVLTFYGSNGGSYVQIYATTGSLVCLTAYVAGVYTLPADLLAVDDWKIGVGWTIDVPMKQAAARTIAIQLWSG
jgi:hypothetical protein